MKRAQTYADLEFIEAHLEHLTKTPLVNFFLQDLIADFQVAYNPLMHTEIPADASDEDIESFKFRKTELFQGFITGFIWARNPGSQTGVKWAAVIERQRQADENKLAVPEKKIIL